MTDPTEAETLDTFCPDQDDLDNTTTDAGEKWKDIDADELTAMKQARAFGDPVVLHEPTMGYGPDTDHHIHDAIRKERLQQVEDTPAMERIELATWSEVAAFCMAASGDARVCLNPAFVETYQYAVRETMASFGVGEDGLPPMLQDVDEMAGNSGIEEYATELRRKLKQSRDSFFVSAIYDEWNVQTVPKRFWTEHDGVKIRAEESMSSEEGSEPRRVSLDEFGE